MLTYALDRRGELPLYEFLCRRIREDIREGRLRAGEKMPSKRGLAEHLGVSVATVDAYAQLLLEGYLRAEERRGYFVESSLRKSAKLCSPAALQAEEAEPEWFADFRTNRVPGEQFPFSVWAKLMREVLTERGRKPCFVPCRAGVRWPCAGDSSLSRQVPRHCCGAGAAGGGGGHRISLWPAGAASGQGQGVCSGGSGLPQDRSSL